MRMGITRITSLGLGLVFILGSGLDYGFRLGLGLEVWGLVFDEMCFSA